MSGPRIAIVYHTREGHTEEVAARLRERFDKAGAVTVPFSVEDAPATLAGFQGVVIGGSVHGGKHADRLVAYVRAHAGELSTLPNAFFSVGLMAANPDERHQAMASGFVSTFIRETGWHPDMVAVIGGALAYTRYGFIKRTLVRAVAKREGLDGDTSHSVDYTDWDAVDDFAADVVAHVRSAGAAPCS